MERNAKWEWRKIENGLVDTACGRPGRMEQAGGRIYTARLEHITMLAVVYCPPSNSATESQYNIPNRTQNENA